MEGNRQKKYALSGPGQSNLCPNDNAWSNVLFGFKDEMFRPNFGETEGNSPSGLTGLVFWIYRNFVGSFWRLSNCAFPPVNFIKHLLEFLTFPFKITHSILSTLLNSRSTYRSLAFRIVSHNTLRVKQSRYQLSVVIIHKVKRGLLEIKRNHGLQLNICLLLCHRDQLHNGFKMRALQEVTDSHLRVKRAERRVLRLVYFVTLVVLPIANSQACETTSNWTQIFGAGCAELPWFRNVGVSVLPRMISKFVYDQIFYHLCSFSKSHDITFLVRILQSCHGLCGANVYH